jgi:hypothetical protein
MNHVFLQDEQGIAIEKIMDENFPDWREKRNSFDTFEDFVSWVDDCVRGVLLQEPTRKDH